ncbi:hypothetical protein JVT61DRAFT_10749 [Boletus reticuloceps]|uniref:Uncharacterized protein n=1 Tax=Boletus reticuloceps TaxID=495285 RepID=A0A8I3A4Q7_9AGAM|nr:hypothetical protein JVT61DRAFT_10749 [Boletus reticuloceps]
MEEIVKKRKLVCLSVFFYLLVSTDPLPVAQELAQLYAPRSPMSQLPERYHVTKENPEPPKLYFAFPHLNKALYKYAEEYDLTRYIRCDPKVPSPATLFSVAGHLSKHVDYGLNVAFPFLNTADCTSIIVLYDNYTMNNKQLIEEDEEDVIEMVQEALGYDKLVRPKWYFDVHDPWQPGDEEDDEDTNQVGPFLFIVSTRR